MKNVFIMTVTLLMLATSMINRAGSEGAASSASESSSSASGNGNSFVGLWEAVDPQDGSHLVLSITGNDEGSVKLLVYDTYFTTCNGGRGIAQGTGEVSAEQSLQVEDYTITCFETGDTTTVPITLSKNSDGTLSRTGATPLALLVIYHQTGK